MKTIAVLAICAITMTGCAPAGLDQIMGRDASYTPTTEPPPRVDCDLIFPPASVLP